MAVDTNELLHRIGAVLRGISDKMDRLIEIGVMLKQPVGDRFVLPPESEMNSITFGEAIKKAKNHFAGASKMVAEEPPKKWRILEPGEVVQDGDWMNARANSQEDGPPDGGWLPAPSFYFGKEASADFGLFFARLVADEPAKEPEPEHPAGPMPDPGEGYRLLSKDPPEELQEGDELQCADGIWGASANARTHKRQGPSIWYRRKIEPPQPEYREPVLPADAGKKCEFSDDGETWRSETLFGFSSELRKARWESESYLWEHARIKKDS